MKMMTGRVGMMTGKIKRYKLAAMVAASVITVFALSACGNGVKAEDYPDALCVSQYDLPTGRAALSKGEGQFALTLAESYYIKTFPELTEENREEAQKQREHHLALVDATAFPDDESVIKAGGVYQADIEKVIPEARKIVIVNTTGAVVKELAEKTVYTFLNAAEKTPKAEEVFHFAGIAFVYNKDAARNNMIVDGALYNGAVLETSTTSKYTVAVNSDLAARLIEKYPEQVQAVREVGSEREIFIAHLEESGIATPTSRFVSKSQRDMPTIVVTVLIVIGVLAIIGVITAYYVLKNKQKKERAARKNQPRIDV